MWRSIIERPETRIRRRDIRSGPAIDHQASPVASAIAYRPHQTMKSPK
jgi:hypothetical protein